MEEVVKKMIKDVKTFANPPYVVKNDKIGYVEQDELLFNITHDFKTVFAYFNEHENKNISKSSLENNIFIPVKCGCFSYAEIPYEFNNILGVSGTLENLLEPEKKIIHTEYNIKKNTYMPSVFGANNLQFNEFRDIKIEKKEDYFNSINKEIEDRLLGNRQDTKRAVLVFFNSSTDLDEFKNSVEFSNHKSDAQILTEEANREEKENIVRNATIQGQITLLTRSFGRGIDFIVKDVIVASNGGVHVLQTFLSIDIAEEIQIKGRTARQGEYGSFSMIILENTLEQFEISQEDMQNNKANIYKLLNEKRVEILNKQYENNKEMKKQLKANHMEAKDFIESLKENRSKVILEYLLKLNKQDVVYNNIERIRTLILVDVTGSMGSLVLKSIVTIGDMFDRMTIILKDKNINPDCFEIQFAGYRNYNSSEHDILVYSDWESKPDNLRNFMRNVKASGGLANEAIEIGLLHANEQNKISQISQVILIGDAPANTEEDVVYKRRVTSSKGFNWNETKFNQPTFYKTEMAKLIEQNIPVHAFYVHEKAKVNFTEIAESSKGRCEYLNIGSDKGTEKLTALLTEVILKRIGGEKDGDALISEYRKRYEKSYL